jgi:hypothetical protein
MIGSDGWSGPFAQPSDRKPRQVFNLAEDRTLAGLVQRLGDHDWATVASEMPGRTPRQCRDRWKCYLSPQLSNEQWSPAEDQMLIDQYSRVGPRWTAIAALMRRRSEVAVKNRWKLLHRRKKGGLFRAPEGAPPDVRTEAQRPSMPPLALPEPRGGPTAAQRELEDFFQSLETPAVALRRAGRQG